MHVLNSFPSAVQDLIRGWYSRGWTVALFCSERARWITGQVIAADGGSSLMNSEMQLG
jgi:hypothetical protein